MPKLFLEIAHHAHRSSRLPLLSDLLPRTALHLGGTFTNSWVPRLVVLRKRGGAREGGSFFPRDQLPGV